MNTDINSEIASVRAQLEQAQSKLRDLEARAKQEAPKPWEPKGGRYFFTSTGRVDQGPSGVGYRTAGSEYPTEEAAESALPYVTFFKRLCCLAQELNPSGKVGGLWWMARNSAGDWYESNADYNGRDIACLFETEEAAERAAEILNRDNWKLPSL